MSYRKLERAFYERETLLVARSLLGKYLVHQTREGIRRGQIVETEAYTSFDPASHTYQGRRTERTKHWFAEGGYAYVYQIYGLHVCLGVITEAPGVAGAVLIRALLPAEGLIERDCSGPSKLCQVLGITKGCDGLDLCGEVLYLEEDTNAEVIHVSQIAFAPRINIDYAGYGALLLWRYFLKEVQEISRTNYEPLRFWRKDGYPGVMSPPPCNLFVHQATTEATTMLSPQALTELRQLPKVELHLHLEGCLTLSTLRTLTERNRRPLPAHLREPQAQGQQHETPLFTTFDEFAHYYYTISSALCHPQDFALLIADLAAYLVRNNVRYCEVAFTPFRFLNRGLDFAQIMEVMHQALLEHRVRERVHFLIDIERDHGEEAGRYVFEQVYTAPSHWQIVGVGLVGQERGFAPALYEALFTDARAHGLGTTAHAGEFGSASDIWQCVRSLGVSRIGHGIAAVHDPALLQYLAEKLIHMEVCPSSNVRLGLVSSYSSHPLPTLWQAGIPLSINSDDPAIFSSEITEEYSHALTHCGFTWADLKRALHLGIQAAFTSAEYKARLSGEIEQGWQQGMAELSGKLA